MHHRETMTAWIVSCSLTLIVAGCDERVAQVAREAADRQAEQNRTMAQLHDEVAAGTRSLVEADSQARHELVAAQRELPAERSRLDEGRDALELDRKQLAAERKTDSLLVPVLHFLGAVALVVVVIGFSWHVLVRLRSDDVADTELVELLVQELTDEQLPRLPADSKPLLPPNSSANRLAHEPSDPPD
jgi:hypothetical protein